ncbi:MAG: hypothetical protein Kow006_33760 [Gammaproteobacteria bacterium]
MRDPGVRSGSIRPGALPALCIALVAGSSALADLPAADPRSSVRNESFAEALNRLGDDYRPRTRHRDFDGRPRFVNRLILEESPYLLQHAHNPVD